jgi:hypothetical protein
MQIDFGSGVAIRRFDMCSNVAFGRPIDLSTPETQSYMTKHDDTNFVDPFKTLVIKKEWTQPKAMKVPRVCPPTYVRESVWLKKIMN